MEKEIEEKKPSKKKYIILGIIGVIVLITLIVLLSTYGRWVNQEKDLNKVLAYKYDNTLVYNRDKDIVKINSIKDFLGDTYELNLDDNEYQYLYCDSVSDCIYMEDSFFLHPGIAIFICIFILIIILYLIIKDLTIVNVLVKAGLASLILASGIVLIFMESYNLADYYGLVNNNDHLVNGKVVGRVINGNKNNEVIEYIVNDVKYIYVNPNKTKSYELDKEVTVYYDKKNYSNAEIKRNPLIINYYVYGLLLIIESILYFRLMKKDK